MCDRVVHRKMNSLEELIYEDVCRTFLLRCRNVCYWSANYVNNEKSPSANSFCFFASILCYDMVPRVNKNLFKNFVQK